MQQGDIMHGFEITRIRLSEELGGQLVEMEHRKSGAKLCWLDNGQANKLFGIAFTTLPEDDTGVFHILEHSVLCGSRKYPVREPFVELLKSSLNTYLNALTFPDKTLYPVSSRNEQDYKNLVSVYLDAVFAPRFLEDENIFLQEGWHIEEDGGKLSCKGVVYNEMKGSMGEERSLVLRRFARMLFPDTSYGCNSGGDPKAICTLSYEQFVRTYRKHYHPGNARVYLDGTVPLEWTLELLDSYFGACGKLEWLPEFRLQQPKSARETHYYELAGGESTENKGMFIFGKIVCSWKEPVKARAMRILADVLAGSNESPMKKALLDSGLAANLLISPSASGFQPYVMVQAKDVKDGREQDVIDLLRSCAAELAAEGLNRDALHAAINRMEFVYREPDEPQGLYRCSEVMNGWQYGGDPLECLCYDDLFAGLREMVDCGGYEALLKEIFLEDEGVAELTMLPSATLGEELRCEEEAQLQAVYDGWTAAQREENRERNARLAAWQQAKDTPEQLATIPTLELSAVSDEMEWTETIEQESGGIRMIHHPENTQNIVYASAYFSLAGCSVEELTSLAMLPRLLGKLPTEKYGVLELERMLKTYTGAMDFQLIKQVERDRQDVCSPCLVVKLSALWHNFDRALELMTEILLHTRLAEKEMVRSIVRQTDINLRQAGVRAGHALGVLGTLSRYSAAGAFDEATGGGTHIRWLRSFTENFDEMFDAFAGLSSRVLEESVCKKRLVISTTAARPCDLSVLAETLPEGSEGPEQMHCAVELPDRIGITVPAQICFAVQGFHLAQIGKSYAGSMDVAAKILSLNHFWNEVRVQGGAYGTGLSVGMGGSMYSYSYRDPSPARTLDVNRRAGDYLRSFCESGEAIDRYIIATLADDDPLQSPREKGDAADSIWFSGYSRQDMLRCRREMLETGRREILEFAEIMDKFAQRGAVCVVGHAEALKTCEDLAPMNI